MRNLGPSNSVQNEIVKWTKPIVERFKYNIDASFSTSLNKVVLGTCIRDAEGNFVIEKTEWITPIIDVDMGEVVGLLFAIQWARELNTVNMDFEIDSKAVSDSIYGRDDVSDFITIINDCRHLLATNLANYRHLLATDLANFVVKFIKRQTNDIAHSLAREAPHHANLEIKLNILHYITTLINNEKV